MDNAKHQMLINDRMLRLEMALLEQNLNKNPRIPTATATPAVAETAVTAAVPLAPPIAAEVHVANHPPAGVAPAYKADC